MLQCWAAFKLRHWNWEGSRHQRLWLRLLHTGLFCCGWVCASFSLGLCSTHLWGKRILHVFQLKVTCFQLNHIDSDRIGQCPCCTKLFFPLFLSVWLFICLYSRARYFQYYVCFSLKLASLQPVSSFPYSKLVCLYSFSLHLNCCCLHFNLLCCLCMLLNQLWDVLVQQHYQFSLIGFSLCWNITSCQNSQIIACYNWWGTSLVGCSRQLLCILELRHTCLDFLLQRSCWSMWICSSVLHKLEQE